MKPMQIKAALAATMIVGLASTSAIAQTAEPTYKGDPTAYKVIFEDANFRVIEANHGPGVKDKSHSHPLPSIVYNVTDCKAHLIGADGKTRDIDTKAGSVQGVPIIPSHTAENTGTANCKQIFVEKK